MRLILPALYLLLSASIALSEDAQAKYNLSTMTPEEVDRAAAGHPRYDFDLAPEDGVVDASGQLIRAAALPAYLRSHAVATDAFIFLWIRADSPPLSTIAATVKPFGDFGLTHIVVRHRPEAIKQNRTTGDARFAAIRDELLAIHQTDQQYRAQLAALSKAGKMNGPERQTLYQQMKEADAANLPKVEAILAEHGWLGSDEVGQEASGTLFLVIQHSPPAIQRKYLPLMREAVKAGKARATSLALLEDRVALGEGRPQTYGSQLLQIDNGPLFVQAIEDPDHVDERRAALGLPPMATYLKNWNLTWDLDAYKKELPHFLEILARQKAATSPASSTNKP